MTDPAALAATHAAAFDDSRAWSAAELAALLDSCGVFLVGDARCFALGRALAGEAELLTVATHPDHRRQGLARACMTSFLARARTLGAHEAFLEVAEDNAPARALYAALGFVEAGRRPGYYRRRAGPPVDALLLRRTLDPTTPGAQTPDAAKTS
ncbi:MAG TPA: ribosomal-protein-alanine acetyltransferase [Rhodobacteraceae bacterium]|jgi:ribosomal-protein-alanine N-acetyltransferase|nr:ribosomal-protein-alanine acetyltransferase [Paracoccaceae bacterium]